jgi:hypothetical protein
MPKQTTLHLLTAMQPCRRHQAIHTPYQKVNIRAGLVSHGRDAQSLPSPDHLPCRPMANAQKTADSADAAVDADGDLPPALEETSEWIDTARTLKKEDLFSKGQSKHIWGEFFKVLDCSDVVLHVIDARNVPGTRCTMVERHIAKHASHTSILFSSWTR